MVGNCQGFLVIISQGCAVYQLLITKSGRYEFLQFGGVVGPTFAAAVKDAAQLLVELL